MIIMRTPRRLALSISVVVFVFSTLAGCESASKKQEAALMQRQINGIDEKVSFVYRNTKAQADLAANVAQLQEAVLTMRGQIEEFNSRAQMLTDRLDKIEASLGEMSGALKDEVVEKATENNARLEQVREELVRLSLETRAFIQLMEKRNGITWESHRRALEKLSEAEGVTPPPPTKPVAPPPQPKVEKIPPSELYQRSYEAYLNGRFDKAVEGFTDYLKLYPDTDLSDNAAYWIGEAYYSLADYDRAATAFDEAASKYPTSNKAPAALLKSAYSLFELGADEHAVTRLKKILDQYPTSNEAIQASERLSAMSESP